MARTVISKFDWQVDNKNPLRRCQSCNIETQGVTDGKPMCLYCTIKVSKKTA